MRTTKFYQPAGLYTSPNSVSEAPEGGLTTANNVVLQQDSVVEPRRGVADYGTTASGASTTFYDFSGYLLRQDSGHSLYYDNSGTWATVAGAPGELDTFHSQGSYPYNQVGSTQQNNNIYFAAYGGVKKLTGVTATLSNPGMPHALGASLALSSATGSWFTNDTAVSYRIVWGKTDANNNLILGAPSDRCSIQNQSGATKDVGLTIIVPPNVTTSDFYQVYRSQLSATAATEPNDEMQLVYEDFPTSAQLTAGQISITDTTTDALKGAYLYTSPSQEGILQSNDTPPQALDIEAYKGHVFYANTKTKQRLNLTLIGTEIATDVGHDTFGYSFQSCVSVSGAATVALFDETNLTAGMAVYHPIAFPRSSQARINSFLGGGVAVINTNALESQPRNMAVSAVIAVSGTTISDRTTAANSATDADYAIFPTTEEVGSYAAWGNPYRFNALRFDNDSGSSTVGVGGTVTWEYLQDTTWVALSGVSDATVSFTAAKNAGREVSWQCPIDWNKRAISAFSATEYFWVRARVTQVYSTNPIADQVFTRYGVYEFGDTITFSGSGFNSVNNIEQFVAGSEEDTTNKVFEVSQSVSVGTAIAETASSLVNVFNVFAAKNPSRNVAARAYYISGYTELPGKMLFEANLVNTSAFYAYSTDADSWNPFLPTTPSTVYSSDEVKANRVYISKYQQPEAVPSLQYLDVGSQNFPIYRIIALRESLFVLKKDGIYRVTGENTTNFTVSLLDPTVIIQGPASAVTFNNQIYCYSNQGVVAVSDAGVAIISRPIENDLKSTINPLSSYEHQLVGIAYESDRQYLLIAPDNFTSQIYVYNAITQAWTKWGIPAVAGIVKSSDDKLYLSTTARAKIQQERKSLTTSDYHDQELSLTISSITSQDSSTAILVLASTTGLGTYWKITKGSSVGLITAINGTSVTVTNLSSVAWTTGAATGYESIQTEVTFNRFDLDNPGELKHFQEIAPVFDAATNNNFYIDFTSNFISTETEVTLPTLQDIGSLRTLVPRAYGRAHWISAAIKAREADTSWKLLGLKVVWRDNSGKRWKLR